MAPESLFLEAGTSPESETRSPAVPHQQIQNPLCWEECPDPSVVRAGPDLIIATTQPGWWDYQPGNSAYPLRRVLGGDFATTEEVGHLFPRRHAPAWLHGAPWAPELHHDPDMGYAATFTGRDPSGRLCIGLAFAERAEGPYREHTPGPFLTNPDIGVIDAHLFFDARTGRRWFYWKEDWNDRPDLGLRTPIFAQELVMAANGPALVGARVKVLENDLPIEGELVEGASVVERGGRYYLFYSAGPYVSGAYLTSVAVGPSPVGPFTKLGQNLMRNDERWEGRGHGYVAQDRHGNDYFVCHGYPARDYRKRVLLAFPIHWEGGWPRIDTRGPGVRPRPRGELNRPMREPIGPEARAALLDALPGVDPDVLLAHRFDAEAFLAFRDAVREGGLTPASSVYTGTIEAPRPGDVASLPAEGTPERAGLRERGEQAIARGEVAVVVLAGGMATRFAGGAPVVKGILEVTDGRSFIELELRAARRAGPRVPFCVMGSFATLGALSDHLQERELLGEDVLLFDQSISLRITPEGDLFGQQGAELIPRESYTTPGHGDFFAALRETGALATLRARGVNTLLFSNVDNLGATLDPALIGLFATLREERGIAMLAETVERAPEDGAKVGLVVRADGRLRILEGLRIPEGLDQSALVEASINTFYFDLASLDQEIPLDVHAVAKEIGGQTAIQAETITCEASGALGPDGEPLLPFAAVRVPREGPLGRFGEGRFYPVKRRADLDRVAERIRASDSSRPARERRGRLEAAYRLAFDGTAAPRLFLAPGRVNLIGEHTDYNEGFALPAAVDRGILALAGPRDDGMLIAVSLDADEPVQVDLTDAAPERQQGWGRYAAAVVTALTERGVRLSGLQVVLTSDLPPGSGMSSSAALCLALAASLSAWSGAELDAGELARVAQRAEHLVGVACGIMDQWAIAHGRRGHALLLDCRSLATEPVPLDLGEHVLLVADTRKPRGLVASEYNLRRSQCEEAARRLGAPSLREVTLDEIERSDLPEPLRSRALHVVGENARVIEATEALRAGRLERFGQLLDASHVSLRDRFEVSCFELDALVDALKAAGGPAVLGARMMGGGFGGCTLSLVRRDAVAKITARAGASYREATGLEAAFYAVGVEDGLAER